MSLAPARLGVLVGVVTGIAILALVPSAWAGRLVVTGHDADLHCTSSETPSCHWLTVAVGYVRGGAPDPAKPVLVLDNTANQAATSLTAAGVNIDLVDPSSGAFATTAITPSNYSALVVASDSTCGGCDLNQPPQDPNASQTPDSDMINARASDIQAFFNSGGGIVALAGGEHRDVFYGFVPLPVGGAPVSPPFTLTSLGSSIGWLDDPNDSSTSDINCCATHNSFALPPNGSALQVAEFDSAGLAETLVADGAISGGAIVRPGTSSPQSSPTSPSPGETGNAVPESGTVLVRLPKKKRFVPIKTLTSIPVGSLIDARRGVVLLTVSDGLGHLFTGEFRGGLFRFTQRLARKGSKKLITDITLAGGKFGSRCGSGSQARAASWADVSRRRVVRYLNAKANGSFNVVGKRAAGLERGTEWKTIDTCDSTEVHVIQGTVLVTDLVKHRTFVVKAPKVYVARAKGARRRR